MAEESVEKARELVVKLKDTKEIAPYDPTMEVDNNLSSFLSKRLLQIEQAAEFKDEVRDNLRARMAEADFGQLVALLGGLESRENEAITSLLAPFIPKAQEAAMERRRAQEKPIEEEVYEGATKTQLQSFQGLNDAIRTIAIVGEEMKKRAEAEEIKKKLESSSNESS